MGANNPICMACVDPSTHAQVVEWLIFTRFRQVILLQTWLDVMHADGEFVLSASRNASDG